MHLDIFFLILSYDEKQTWKSLCCWNIWKNTSLWKTRHVFAETKSYSFCSWKILAALIFCAQRPRLRSSFFDDWKITGIFSFSQKKGRLFSFLKSNKKYILRNIYVCLSTFCENLFFHSLLDSSVCFYNLYLLRLHIFIYSNMGLLAKSHQRRQNHSPEYVSNSFLSWFQNGNCFREMASARF